MNIGVYRIYNVENDDSYIGSSVNLSNRIKRHIYELKNNKHHNNHLQNAWNKYGYNKMAWEILVYCDRDMTLYYEQIFLDRYSNKRYNISNNAEATFLGVHHTRETKEKIKNFHKGKKKSEEQKIKMSLAKKGKKTWNFGIPCSKETKDKISKTKSGCPGYWTGKKRSPETIEKQRKSLKRHHEKMRNRVFEV